MGELKVLTDTNQDFQPFTQKVTSNFWIFSTRLSFEQHSSVCLSCTLATFTNFIAVQTQIGMQNLKTDSCTHTLTHTLYD